MASIFDDILQRAERLHTDANMGDGSELPIVSHGVENNRGDDSMVLDTGLADIFRQSEEMWKRKKLTDEKTISASALSSLKASKDVSQLSITSLPAFSSGLQTPVGNSKSQEYDENGPYDSYSNKEIDRYVENSFERARIEAERSFLNQQILERNRSGPSMNLSRPLDSSFSRQQTRSDDSFYQPRTENVAMTSNDNSNQPLEYQQNVFAEKIDVSLRRNCQGVIKDALMEAANEINDKDVDDIWEKVFAVCSKPLLEDPESVRDLRSSRKWAEHVINKATKYLQDHFKSHAESLVENNLTIAKRGGVPGTSSLIDAYLNVKQFSYASVEDGGFYGKHPTWMVLFFCLRLGDITAAANVAKKLFNVSHCSTLVGIVANLTANQSVEPETKSKLGAEWRQGSAMCQDSFKKAIYGIFLGFDCPEVNATIEDWLWARLVFCKLHSKDLVNSFKQLQNTVCVEFGEEYFVQKGANCLLYFTALILTGQLEQAIKVLFTANLLLHAVHISILAYQLKLLVLTECVSSEILTADVHDGTVCQLNFARIVLLYVKNFEMTNVNYALNYCFFLNKFVLDENTNSKGGRNVFESCVSRIVYLTQETDLILGKLNQCGERLPGLIDKFTTAFNVQDIISYVAADTNSSGDPFQACKLFALADRPNNAVKLVCRQLSLCINAVSNGDESYIKTIEMALWLSKKYIAREDLEKQNLDTLATLIDLNAFFRLYREQNYEAAIRVIQKVEFIPLDPDEVQTRVSSFAMVPEEVRPVLPDICTALMKSIVALHDAQPDSSLDRASLKSFAKSIVLYTAMIPYRFPIASNSLMLQLQSKIV